MAVGRCVEQNPLGYGYQINIPLFEGLNFWFIEGFLFIEKYRGV
jgi:hypothetical protein